MDRRTSSMLKPKASSKQTGVRKRTGRLVALGTAIMVLSATMALASQVNAAVVDADGPAGSVTLGPGDQAPITINLTITGEQAGTATFKVNRDWTLANGVFTGSNPQQFQVGPRNAQDPATLLTAVGKVIVSSGQAAGGPFTLQVSAFDITNSNQQGAKLAAGTASSYQVTVVAAAADTTAPQITITSPVNGASYVLGSAVAAAYSCQDEAGGSGLKSCVGPVANGANIDTSSIGTKTFIVNAEDNVGNKSSLVHTYNVIYDWNGFFRPVDNRDENGKYILNAAKAGGAIPVKFSLGGNQGLAIFESGYPKSQKIDCDPTAEVAGVEETATAGNSSLSYNPDTQEYTYVWKTDKSWAGTCRQLVLVLNDGTVHRASFKLSK